MSTTNNKNGNGKPNQVNKNKNTKKYNKNKKPDTTKKQGLTSLKVVKSPNETTANGVRKNIMVYCDLDKLAAECIPVGVLCKALAQGAENSPQNQIYWAYWAFMKDIIALMSNQTSAVFGRLDYLSRILCSLMPKSVDGLKKRTIAYSWRNTDTIGWMNPSINIRGKMIYWYVPSVVTDGVWLTQQAPSNPSTEEIANTTLALAYNVIAGDKNTNPNLHFIPGQTMFGDYKNDVSCFAGVSPYYGESAGNSSSSFASAESEVPYKSQILATLTTYKQQGDRVARFYHSSSGGSIEAFSFGLIPEMRREYYNTVYPVTYKYLDFDELYVFLVEWYSSLTSKAAYAYKQNNIPLSNEIVVALSTFPCTAQQFALMLRQVLLSRFVTQTNVQTNTYSSDPYGFEPFRVGSNCYPRQYEISIAIPSVMNENLNALLPRIFEVSTKYASSKNAFIAMPVWGTYKSWSPANPTIEVFDSEGSGNIYSAPMFMNPDASDPNIWDGTNSNSSICDLNRTPKILEIRNEWNSRIAALLEYSSTVSYMGGESNGALLLHTRYAEYPPSPRRELSSIMPMTRLTIPRENIVQERVEVQRTTSKSKIDCTPQVKEYYVPKDGSLLQQKTDAYASTSRITNAEKDIYSYLILPTIVVEPNVPPYQRQARVAYVEPYVLDMPKDDTSVGGRYVQLKALAALCATGTAGSQNNSLTQVVDYLTRKGRGGFIGDVLSVLAKEIPI